MDICICTNNWWIGFQNLRLHAYIRTTGLIGFLCRGCSSVVPLPHLGDWVCRLMCSACIRTSTMGGSSCVSSTFLLWVLSMETNLTPMWVLSMETNVSTAHVFCKFVPNIFKIRSTCSRYAQNMFQVRSKFVPHTFQIRYKYNPSMLQICSK